MVSEPQLNVLSMSVSSGKIIVKRKTMNREILKRDIMTYVFIYVLFLHSTILQIFTEYLRSLCARQGLPLRCNSEEKRSVCFRGASILMKGDK